MPANDPEPGELCFGPARVPDWPLCSGSALAGRLLVLGPLMLECRCSSLPTCDLSSSGWKFRPVETGVNVAGWPAEL